VSTATKIEWTRGDDGAAGATWSPVTGCTKVSEGCCTGSSTRALRTAIADAASTAPGTDPDRASFTIALNTARDQVTLAAGVIAILSTDLPPDDGP
jgi:protein gp37